jgi:glycerophosphoryl diester phosphodiesterase
MRHPYFDLPRPIVFGHRGACGERPENTLVSFQRALDQGAQILETDVHLSADGQVVIHHDAELARTTGAAGTLRERTLAELRCLDAGHGFSPDAGRSHPFRGQGIRIPSLLEAFEAFPGVRFNVELKSADPRLARDTVQLVREAKREEITLLAAAEDPVMAQLRTELARSDTRAAVGAAVGDVTAFVRAALEDGPPPPEPMALQIPPDFAGQPLVTRELVDFAHRHDVQVHVWTVNEEAEMRRLLELGVDGVMSDFPARLRRVVDAQREV